MKNSSVNYTLVGAFVLAMIATLVVAIGEPASAEIADSAALVQELRGISRGLQAARHHFDQQLRATGLEGSSFLDALSRAQLAFFEGDGIADVILKIDIGMVDLRAQGLIQNTLQAGHAHSVFVIGPFANAVGALAHARLAAQLIPLLIIRRKGFLIMVDLRSWRAYLDKVPVAVLHVDHAGKAWGVVVAGVADRAVLAVRLVRDRPFRDLGRHPRHARHVTHIRRP